MFHKGTKMGEVILMAQLRWELHLFLFFLSPISIICGFLLVLIFLPFLSSPLFPTVLMISLLRGLCKNICILGWGGSLCCLHRRMFDGQLMELFGQIFYSGRINGPNHTIGMGSRLRFLCIVGRPRCLRNNLIQHPVLRINQIQLLGPKDSFFLIRHFWSRYILDI